MQCRIVEEPQGRAVEQGDNMAAVVVAAEGHIQDYKLELEQEAGLHVQSNTSCQAVKQSCR